MYKLLLLTLICFWCKNTFSQENTCHCTEYESFSSKQKDNRLQANALLKSTDENCKAKGFEIFGSLLTDINELDSALVFLTKAENIYIKNTCNDAALINLYKSYAQLYYTKSDFANAQLYSFKMLHCTETTGNIYEQAKCNTMIAQLFNQTNQAPKGIIYTRKAAVLLPKITIQKYKIELLFLLSKRYLWHFQDTKTQTSLDSSQLFSLQQIGLARQTNSKSFIAKAFSNLQGVEYEKGNFKKATQLLDSSFIYTEKNNYPDLRLYFYDKSDLLIEQKKLIKAEICADSALYYDSILGNKAFIAETYELIARIAQEKGDFKKAFEFTELGRTITDSIRNVEKTAVVTKLEQKYNQTKNEKTIKELALQRSIYLLIALAGILGVLAIGFFFRQQSLKHKKDILETEQRLNRARMNPHFFFNALTTLQKFALRENDGKTLASNLSKFSNIMRETLESTYKEYVTVEQEMEFLNEYLEVQKIRFPKTFSYEITADNALDIDELQIPSMIIQPFVENSIEHGFVGIDYAGHISIHFSSENNEILIKIQDNGKGLITTIKNENEHISRASQIIKDRIYLLNIKLKTKAGFSIDNDENGNGVIVKIHLPLLYKNENK